MELNQVKTIYFLGIGGIGMSALARYFNAIGKKVYGYDKTPTTLTDSLIKEGISIHFEDQINHIPLQVKNSEASPHSILVIYTPAIPKDSEILNWLQDHGYQLYKRAQILGAISIESNTIAVAGTHGKTSTSAMIGHIFTEAGLGCNAFLGGIASNYNSNMLLNPRAQYCIVEADEFDRSFLTLYPQCAVITSTDADHLDIYGASKNLLDSFKAFASQVDEGGYLIQQKEIVPLENKAQTIRYAVDQQADAMAMHLQVKEGKYHFDYRWQEIEMKDLVLGMPGRHNVENATAAITACLIYGISVEAIKNALASFSGVKRRFEYQYQHKSVTFIDDYAHHPTEIRALYASLREMFPGKKLTAIFQPHLFSRTRDFADDFAASLSNFDEILLLDIYPAREKPIPGIDSQLLLDKIKSPHKKCVQKSELLDQLNTCELEVLLTIGAGDIDKELDKISHWLTNKYGPNLLQGKIGWQRPNENKKSV